jgi:hypothetical protein
LVENNIEILSFINVIMNKRIPQPCLDPRGESKPGLDTDKYRHTSQFDEYNNLLWPKHNPFHIPLVKLPCLDSRGEQMAGIDTNKDRHMSQFDEYNTLPWPKHNPLHIPLVKLPCLDRRGEVVTTESTQKCGYKNFSYQRYELNINYDQNMCDKKIYDQKQEGLKYTIKNKNV